MGAGLYISCAAIGCEFADFLQHARSLPSSAAYVCIEGEEQPEVLGLDCVRRGKVFLFCTPPLPSDVIGPSFGCGADAILSRLRAAKGRGTTATTAATAMTRVTTAATAVTTAAATETTRATAAAATETAAATVNLAEAEAARVRARATDAVMPTPRCRRRHHATAAIIMAAPSAHRASLQALRMTSRRRCASLPPLRCEIVLKQRSTASPPARVHV